MSDATNSAIAALNAQAPDLGVSAPSQPDNSALTQQAPPPPPPAGTTPSGAPTLGADTSSAPTPQGDGSAQNPVVVPSAPQTGGTQSVWKTLVAGALAGLAGGGSAHSVGAGLAGGVAHVERLQQQKFENQQKLQFASLEAAHNAVQARLQAAQADNLELDVKQKQSDLAANTEAYPRPHGLKPDAVISGSDPGSMHSQGSGTLTTLAQQNGGTIPRVATINDPIGAGQDPTSHSIKVYAPNNPDTVGSGMSRKLIDTYLNITRGYP